MPFLNANAVAIVRVPAGQRVWTTGGATIRVTSDPSNFPTAIRDFAEIPDQGGNSGVIDALREREVRIWVGPNRWLEYVIGTNANALTGSNYSPSAVAITGGTATLTSVTATTGTLTTANLTTANATNLAFVAAGRQVVTTAAAAAATINKATNVILTPAAAITLTVPVGVADGETRRIAFGTATTVTWAATGGTMSPSVKTSFAAGESITLVWNAVAGSPAGSTVTTWYVC